MVNQVFNNPIIEVVERLSLMAVVFVPLMIVLVQGIKELTGLEGARMKITAIGVNLVFGLGFSTVFFYPQAAVYVGVVLFLLILAVAPLGGYDLMKRFAGENHEES